MVQIADTAWDALVEDIANAVAKDEIYVSEVTIMPNVAKVYANYTLSSKKEVKTMEHAWEVLRHVMTTAKALLQAKVYGFTNPQTVLSITVNTSDGISLSAAIFVMR